MRGADTFTESLFTMRHLDDFVPADHPLRVIRVMVNKALTHMDELFARMYAADIKGGRPSIAPEKLLRAMLLYQTVAEHYETWLELASAGQFDGQCDHHTPKPFVRKAFATYLECGIFAHGFARARCEDCGHGDRRLAARLSEGRSGPTRGGIPCTVFKSTDRRFNRMRPSIAPRKRHQAG